MSFVKTVWGFLFRLFPCPTALGLRRAGNPTRNSPVLVTCNFHLTVKRLMRILEEAGVDAWVLVAESRGVNVWCAAGGEEFNTHSVVSAVKTSSIADLVDHRRLILPPLGAPGIRLDEVRAQTGWAARWGPVRAADLPAYLAQRSSRDEHMKRVTYDWRERLDTGLGSLFPFYLLGAIGFLLFGRGLLAEYLLAGALTFVFFMLACPWLPGERGLTKVILPELVLAGALLSSELVFAANPAPRSVLIIAMATLLVYSSELGGLASTMPSDLDPFLARLGIGALGNVNWAGTVRTELLNGDRRLSYERDACNGCRQCVEVCPQGVWKMDEAKRAVLARRQDCTACRACLVQCSPAAIQAAFQQETPSREPLRASPGASPP
jgi:NAD-dependent dihydropyrimidine dehydrogenase PreA subunit